MAGDSSIQKYEITKCWPWGKSPRGLFVGLERGDTAASTAQASAVAANFTRGAP
jgi:hypothetical protein